MLAAPDLGTTVNVGVVEGGSRGNVVAERASMAVDIRVTSMAEASRVDAAMRALSASDPRIGCRRARRHQPAADGAIGRRCFVSMIRRARWPPNWATTCRKGTTGGASDGNFTAALGVPTLDGLGAIGDGAHARHEHIVIDALPFRSALVAGLHRPFGRGEARRRDV